jgi:hypothetical protein
LANARVCDRCRYVRPKRRAICRGIFEDPILLFRQGGHHVKEYHLPPFPAEQPQFTWRLRREALNLYTSRVRVTANLGLAIVTRQQEGLPVNHLRERLREVHRATRAHERALASAGVLTAVERIIKSERFTKENG